MRERGKIHAATLSGSTRLKAVLEFLKKRAAEGATTREIIEATGYCAINSIAAELRQCGEKIVCRARGRSENGAAVYRYWRLEPGELF